MDNTDLKTEAPFVKMSINVILTGAISKASGGDFYQGAMRALVVWLYNEAGHGAGRKYDPLSNKKYIEREVLKHLPSKLGKKMFKQYWWAKGDYTLTKDEFNHLTTIAKYYKGKKPGKVQVSFYGTIEARAFGGATIYLDKNLNPVGFYDIYDFDARLKNYLPSIIGGTNNRSIKNEAITDIVSIMGYFNDAESFNICYGIGCN